MSFLISKISFSDEDECLMGGTKCEQQMCFQMKTNRFENAFKSGESAGISVLCERSKTEPFENNNVG